MDSTVPLNLQFTVGSDEQFLSLKADRSMSLGSCYGSNGPSRTQDPSSCLVNLEALQPREKMWREEGGPGPCPGVTVGN